MIIRSVLNLPNMALIYFIVLKNRAFRAKKKAGEWRDVKKMGVSLMGGHRARGSFHFQSRANRTA